MVNHVNLNNASANTSVGEVRLWTAGSIHAQEVLIAVRDQAGASLNLTIARDMTLHGSQTLTANRDWAFAPGAYTCWVSYSDDSGEWHDLAPRKTLQVP